MRLALITDVPTPYRDPLFHAVSTELAGEMKVIFLGEAVKRRTWTLQEREYDAVILSKSVWSLGEQTIHPLAYPDGALRAWRPDVVIIAGWNQPGYWSALAWCGRNRIPALAWVESHAMSGSRRGRYANRIRQSFLRRFAGAVVPSAESDEYLRRLGFRGRVLVLPNAIAKPPKDSTRQRRDGSRTLLFLGALSERKNPLRVLDIAAAGAASGNAVRVLVGGIGPLAEPMRAKAAKLGVEVLFSGYVEGEELEQLWQAADCLVLPSLSDPAPLVLSEAAGRGVPFVASTGCGGTSTLIDLGAVGAALPLDAADHEWWHAATSVMETPSASVQAVLPDRAAARLVTFVREVAATPTSSDEISC